MTEAEEMDVREKSCVIIRRGNEYLVGKVVFSNELRWSISKWDAWNTRDMRKARKIAERVGGVPVLFNPIVGVTKAVEA